MTWTHMLHLLGATLWMGGVLAGAVLLAPMARADSMEARDALLRGQKLVLRVVADGGAAVALLSGAALIWAAPAVFLGMRWLQVKLVFVALLVVMEVVAGRTGKKMSREEAGITPAAAWVIVAATLTVVVCVLLLATVFRA